MVPVSLRSSHAGVRTARAPHESAPGADPGPARPVPRETERRTGPPAQQDVVPIDGDLGPLGRRMIVVIPLLLLVVSWGVAWAAGTGWLEQDAVLWALVPTFALLMLRGALEVLVRRRGRGGSLMSLLYALHLVLVLWATTLNPLTCIYAFVGYLDADRYLRGRLGPAAVVVLTALLCALGQVGGLVVALAVPQFYASLAVINLMIAGAMTLLTGERERVLEQREKAARELDRVNRENARLQAQLMDGARRSGVAEERARLSREIHDTVAQGLVGVIRQLEAVREDIDPSSRERVARAEEAARDSLLEARRAVEALGPHQLHDADVVDALADLVARWAHSHRVVATFDADDAPRQGRNGDVLVRILQEALSNIARHALARTVEVSVAGVGDEWLLQIRDDGTGFDPATVVRGHGLGNMAERARRAGGRLGVDSAAGRGCAISAWIPR
ncbi:sensor histidine kinase [Brachybacterium sp. AOP43-C2-M15]|uniref:sensor histidine kinase n=1 Tax=Brachybacterium sp. AOP43-C2-M15 TaxID=3457661 RepID=UPI00403428B9